MNFLADYDSSLSELSFQLIHIVMIVWHLTAKKFKHKLEKKKLLVNFVHTKSFEYLYLCFMIYHHLTMALVNNTQISLYGYSQW